MLRWRTEKGRKRKNGLLAYSQFDTRIKIFYKIDKWIIYL